MYCFFNILMELQNLHQWLEFAQISLGWVDIEDHEVKLQEILVSPLRVKTIFFNVTVFLAT